MSRHITVVTPENVRIEYELAGLASRAGAAIIDLLLQVLLILAVLGVRMLLSEHGRWPGTTWANALLAIASFVMWYGYYVYFETVWNGQSPGKRYARMRTIREGGTPIDFASAAVRNLVRIVDMIPGIYLVGMISVLANSRNKRLGDFAAGTLVVKERSEWMHTKEKQTQEEASAAQYPEAELVRNIELVSPDDFETIKRFVERKAELDGKVREELASKIAVPLMAKLGIEDNGHIGYSNMLTEIYNKCAAQRGMR
ncbi:RDD family protein [bacterium]|nr:RDD family protein [bacterium]